jgi:hypothetical protein
MVACRIVSARRKILPSRVVTVTVFAVVADAAWTAVMVACSPFSV